MAQTLIAIGALTVASLLMLTNTRHEMAQQETVRRIEIERVAGTVALDVLGHISAQEFDSKGTVSDESELTPQPFTVGNAVDDGVPEDDVDDFHRIETFQRAGGGYDQLLFDVDVEVRYVDESGAFSASQTYQKEVTVSVSRPELASPVVMTQVVVYQAS